MNEIEQLENRATQIKAQLDDLPEAAKMGMKMLLEEIQERLAALRAGRADPYM